MASKSKIKPQDSAKLPKSAYQGKCYDDYLAKYFWLVIPILTILYYMYRNVSVGFYQDDEIGQYINMINFWHDPAVILGNGPKPGYKIFMVVPALLGYDWVLIMNSLIASLTVYLTFVMLRVYKVNYAAFGALLLATQPMFLELSFRSYSEIFTALLFVTFLILYKKEKYIFSSLVLSYIFTVRQESALLIIIMFIILVINKRYVPALLLGVFPVIYTLLGYMQTGDILYLVTQMKSVAGLNYKSQGLFHYFRVYIFIIGPVCLTLFLLGFFGFAKDMANYKEYLKEYMLFYVIFVTIFVTQMLTMINDGPNPGNWRYLLHISPIAAFFATVGLNNLADKKFKNVNYYVSGALAVLVFLFLSKNTDGFQLLDTPNYTKALFVLIVFVFSILMQSAAKYEYLNRLSIVLIIVAAIHLYFGLYPKPLSPENITVKETAQGLDSIKDIDSKEKLANHTLLMFYSKSFKDNPKNFRKLDSKSLAAAPKGSIIIWDTHYGYRPEFTNDVQFETLQKDSVNYKLLSQNISTDKRFYSFIFEKQ